MTYSAAVAAALAALFQPIPAMAAPGDDPVLAAGIPDTGSRPTTVGALVLPGTPVSPTATPSTIPGSATNPALQKIEKGRFEVDQLGDELLKLKTDRDLAQSQVTTALQRVTDAQANLRDAQTNATAAAGEAMQQAAAVPPGALDSGLIGLDQLARLQRGEAPSDDTAARRLEAAQVAAQVALDEQTTTATKHDNLVAQYTKLNAQLTQKQTALTALENAHRDELNAAEAAASVTDQALGSEYLAGSNNGRGADPRAVKALQFALAQRGDPYVWSEEGPDRYDCSGLMYAAYRQPSVGFPLMRVSRDQYWQTRNKVVDRYSLLPGDLLFFSYSNSWTGIHHVAMYAGDGMMVEAPRTGLNVRLVPVRWSRLFQATRVFGAVEGGADDVPLGSPDPEEPATGGTSTGTPSPSPSATRTSKPGTSPSTKPTGSKSPKPTKSGTPSPTPSPSSSTPKPGGSTPSGGGSSSSSSGSTGGTTPTGGSSPTGGGNAEPTGATSTGATATATSSANATENATKSAEATTAAASASSSPDK
ncbi:NlpC/P60 family protein [Actinoplanes oblitus]|uniref:NlpC/P60 family protein n=1 Tax=Actinoplanes oblitus TaxID=3040509 RepID=A0ABY8WFW0_9ACTN|nr:NlpC/P60 family protein [Actinoplanes oblitus]WIM96746.1 NlpC/P60 family protein [Actinoplanes oblitus]